VEAALMLEFLTRLFRGEPSGQKAKERLRLVLLSDHLALAPDVVEAMKTDLLEVISRYVEVDETNVEVTFEHREHEVAMLANIPIRSMKERERPRVKLAPVVAFPKAETLAAETVDAVVGDSGEAAPLPFDQVPAPPPQPEADLSEKTETVVADTVDAALADARTPSEAVAPKPRRRRRRKSAARRAMQAVTAPAADSGTQDTTAQA
jgi:cell division topological specificity factor